MHELSKSLSMAGISATASLVTDENFGEQAMDAAVIASINGSEIAFLSSHGRVVNHIYSFRLRRGEWLPAASLGSPGPAVMVFDTCDVVEPSRSVGDAGWLSPGRTCPAVV